ncbi:10277_t:CDS:1, partial [Cetraspora pellucida]
QLDSLFSYGVPVLVTLRRLCSIVWVLFVELDSCLFWGVEMAQDLEGI